MSPDAAAAAAIPPAAIPVADVEDAPSLEFRGIHYYPSRDGLDFYRRLVERVLAPLKFNHIVLQCESTQWDTDRKIWIRSSIPKDQLARYVKIARDNGIEPIPLVQSLGHMEWMFRNGAN